MKKLKKETEKHNGIISFWKFSFCLLIIIFHGREFALQTDNPLFPGGSIGVEFFFLVSGFLLAKKALNIDKDGDLGKETINYVGKKYKSFLPYTICAGIIALIVLTIYGKMSVNKVLLSFFDIFLLRMTGVKTYVVNRPIWYISSMLIAMLIIYPLVRKYKNKYLYIIAPAICLLGFGYLGYTSGNLRGADTLIFFTYKGNIRAFLELSLGCTLYGISESIKQLRFTKFGKFIITLLEIGFFVFPFVVSQFAKDLMAYDFLILIGLSIAIVFAFSNKTLDYILMNNKFNYWLEKFSLSLFMFHMPIRIFMLRCHIFKNYNYPKKLLIFLLISFIVSLVMMYAIDFFKKKKLFSGLIVKKKDMN